MFGGWGRYLEQFLRHESTATDLSPTQQACAQLCLRALHQIRIIGDKMVVVDAEEVAKVRRAMIMLPLCRRYLCAQRFLFRVASHGKVRRSVHGVRFFTSD